MNEILRIGIDIDDVLADSLPAYLRAFNRRFGLEIPEAEAGWEIFRRYPEIPADELEAFFAELYRADFLGSRPLVPGAREGVERLHRAGHCLFIITGRLRRDRDITARWMGQAGLSAFFEAIVDRDGTDAPLHKRRAVEELRLDVLLEDEYAVALAAAEIAGRVLLFDRPWNQGSLPGHAVRIHSWSEVGPCLSGRTNRGKSAACG
ncbi:MAG: HAD family hydrolase [Candidatus Methylomirabilales bacterium]